MLSYAPDTCVEHVYAIAKAYVYWTSVNQPTQGSFCILGHL